MQKMSSLYRMLRAAHRVFFWFQHELMHATDPFLGYYWQKRRFFTRLGYALDLKSPKSFNQKIAWKKLFDRNPNLSITGDKFGLRGYVQECLGEAAAQGYLVPLLYVTNDPATIPFEKLPADYIVKVSYGSGWNIVVRNGNADKAAIVMACKKWLTEGYGRYKNEWAYENMKRNVVVEELLKDEKGGIPKDFKLFMFGGKCRMIQVDLDRFGDRSRTLIDPQWNLIPATLKFKQGPMVERPENLDEMISLAAQLSKNFDFVRVDLYSINGKVYVGEMTHYPGSGLEVFTPQSFDFELGAAWDIKSKYWKT